MTTTPSRQKSVGPEDKITKEMILGTERRWRRFGEPVPAGGSLKEDGSPDYGIFGPGSVVWEVLLHPALVVFHHAGQQQMQDIWKPIVAGIRDHEPLTRKARAGTLTMFDTFERASRGAGMHLPMWLGDTKTAELMAKHLHNIHRKVAGPVIDIGNPELGGYDGSGPRESMWAALTEMHPMLRMYEAFAFRDGKFPHKLEAAKRDQFMEEVGAYLRLHGAVEEEIPHSMADVAALYEKYSDFVTHSDTIKIAPEDGLDYSVVMAQAIKKNFSLSQLRAVRPQVFLYLILGLPVTGALPGKARRSLNISKGKERAAIAAKTLVLPLAWILQRGPVERHYMRLMWGPDGVNLFLSARKLHAEALAERAALKPAGA
jgi:uncharacterized protein (DUF2236 family)